METIEFHSVRRIIDQPGVVEGIEVETINRMAARLREEVGGAVPPVPVGHECYHLVIFGFGLGEHVARLARQTKCKNLIIVEPNIEFLYHSLFTFEWSGFFDEFSSEDRKLHIIPEQSEQTIEFLVRDCVHPVAPHYVDGMTMVTSFDDEMLERVSRSIEENALFLNMPMGFLMDECDMMRNAFNNLKGHQGYYYKRKSYENPLPALVVATGPSIEQSIGVVKEYQDRAIVISCGTVLRKLMAYGIVPDFHVEMENTPEIPDIIAREAGLHDLSSITLIASFTVIGDVAKHFGNTVFYFRHDLAPSPVFSTGDDSTVVHSFPTVSNLGFSYAQEIGCPEIYLLGVDLGARDTNQHHASDTAYDDNPALLKSPLDIPRPANFGDGVIMTDDVFLWAKDSLEKAITWGLTDTQNAYNCSDGLRIDGATSMPADDISLPALAVPKREIIEAETASYPVYGRSDFDNAWNQVNLDNDIVAFRDELLSTLQSPVTDGSAPAFELEFMRNLTAKLFPDDGVKNVILHFYQGSMFYPMRALHYWAMRGDAGARRQKIIDIGRQELEHHIRAVADKVLELNSSLH